MPTGPSQTGLRGPGDSTLTVAVPSTVNKPGLVPRRAFPGFFFLNPIRHGPTGVQKGKGKGIGVWRGRLVQPSGTRAMGGLSVYTGRTATGPVRHRPQKLLPSLISSAPPAQNVIRRPRLVPAGLPIHASRPSEKLFGFSWAVFRRFPWPIQQRSRCPALRPATPV